MVVVGVGTEKSDSVSVSSLLLLLFSSSLFVARSESSEQMEDVLETETARGLALGEHACVLVNLFQG